MLTKLEKKLSTSRNDVNLIFQIILETEMQCFVSSASMASEWLRQEGCATKDATKDMPRIACK